MKRRLTPTRHEPEFAVRVDRSDPRDWVASTWWRCSCFGPGAWREAPTAVEASAAHRRHKEEVMAR